MAWIDVWRCIDHLVALSRIECLCASYSWLTSVEKRKKKAQDQYVIVEWWRNPREKKLDAHFEEDEGENKLSLRSRLSSTEKKKKETFLFFPFFVTRWWGYSIPERNFHYSSTSVVCCSSEIDPHKSRLSTTTQKIVGFLTAMFFFLIPRPR